MLGLPGNSQPHFLFGFKLDPCGFAPGFFGPVPPGSSRYGAAGG
jgi:hypothetical protein